MPGIPGRRMVALCAVGCGLLAAPAAVRAETLRVAYVHPRGFYDKAVLGRLEAPMPLREVKGLAVAGELYSASQDQVSSTTLSFYVMLRHYSFPTAMLSPFVGVGAGIHAIRSRRPIAGIGTLTGTESAVKGHFWTGVRGPSLMGVRPFLETRWTVPSKYVFDYVAVGAGL